MRACSVRSQACGSKTMLPPPPPPPPPQLILIWVLRKAFLLRASLLAVLLSVAGMVPAQEPVPFQSRFVFDPSAVTIVEGQDRQVQLMLQNNSSLPKGVEMTVDLSVADGAVAQVTPSSVVFTTETTSREVTVLGVAAGSVTLTASVGEAALAGSGLPDGSTVEPAELVVTVVPPPVHLRLAFARTSLEVLEDATATAILSLLGVPAGAAVTVRVSVPDATTARVVTPESAVFTAAATSRKVAIVGVAAGSVTVTATVDANALADSDLPPNSTVASVELAVTVVPPPVRLQLVFELSALEVVVVATATVTLRLPDVPEGAEVTVTLSVADGAVAQVMPSSVVFTTETPSREVTVLGVVAGNTIVTATVDMDALAGSDLPPSSTVEPAELPITVVPPPVDLQLSFEPSALEVVAGAAATATLRLLDVPEGAAVTVELSVADELVMPDPVIFTATTQSHTVTVTGEAAGSVTLTASVGEAALADSGLPPNSTVASAELAVTVVPAPVHLQLAFDPSTLAVTVGGERTAVLSLSGVPAGATVTVVVTVNASDEETAQVMLESAVFDATQQSRKVTVLGVAEGSATVTATVGMNALADSDLPPNSTVASAELAVTVVPPPVHLQLAFELSALKVVAGATATATLRLPDVPAGAEVAVALGALGEMVQVTPESVVFDATTQSREVTVTGVAEGSVTLTASVGEAALADSDLPPDSTVASAELAVTVVPAPVHLQLAFDQTSLTVAAGAHGTATLRLLDVPADAAVTVTLSLADTATALVMSSTVTFTADTPSWDVTVTGVAEGSETLTATVGMNALADSDLPPNSTVASANLAVTVVLPTVELQLAFEPAVLEVAVGATATAVLSLSGVPVGAEVEVELSVADVTMARVRLESVVFDAETPSRNVTVEGVAVGRAVVTAVADVSGAVGLAADSTVASADLAVTVGLQLAFEPAVLEVAVGATATAVLSLLGVPEGATVAVALSATDAATVQVMPSSAVEFSAAVASREVTVVAGEVEGSVTVTAVAFGDSNLPLGLSVASVELPVTVVPVPPVELQLAFEPAVLEVAVGATATAVLSLLSVPAGAAVTVRVSVPDATTARVVTPESAVFTAATTSHEVTVLGVAAGSAILTAVADDLADSGLLADSTVAIAELVVTVVVPPVHLAFDPSALTVVAGSSETAMLRLPDVPDGAMVTVMLSSADAATARVVTPELVTFTVTTQSHVVMVEGVAEGSVTVTAVVDVSSGLPPDSTVAFAELAVTVVPPPVHLAFDPSALTVVAGSSETAMLRLPDVPDGAMVTVMLSSADAATALVMPSTVVFTVETTSHEVTIEGVAAGSATVTATVDMDALAGSDLPPNSIVEPAELPITVVPPPVDLQLSFDPMSLEVVAGATATAGLRLPDVPEGTEVEVSLSAADEATASVMPESVIFTAQTPSTEVTVTGVAVGRAVVTAVGDTSGLPPNSTVGPAELAVTVVPAPVDLQLAFEPTTLTVAVGSERTATLRLLGVPADATVTVALSTAATATAQVVQESVIFTTETTSRNVTVLGVAAGSATLTAVFVDDLADSGLPAGSVVASVELPVTVVPPPVDLQLSFDPMSLEVVAGATATAGLRLPDVPEGTEVEVSLSAADEATASVMPESVIFTAQTPSTEVTVTGVAVGRAVVTAVGDTSGLPPNSTVGPAELAVTVVPAPVDLQLAFEPTTLTVAVGSERTATLRLLGVPADATVTVALSTAATATAQVVQESVIFTTETTSRNVTVLGVAAGSATLTAVFVDDLADSGLPAGSVVASVELPVTVVPGPVELQLAFEPSALTVAVGAHGTATLRLLDVPAGAAVTVALSATGAATVQVVQESVVFDAATTSHEVTVLGVTAGSATLTASVGEAALADSGLPAGSGVASAQLAVTVVPGPVELQLAFEPPALTVAVGSERTATLRLSGVPEGATVTVALSATGAATVQVVQESVIFTATTQSHAVTVLGVTAGSATVTAAVGEAALADSGLPAGSGVASVELAVTVVPGPVELQLAFEPTTLTVAVGSERTATLRLLDVPAGAEVTVTLSVPDATTARVVTPELVTFTATTQSHVVMVEGVTAGSATLTAAVGEAVLADSGLPAGSTVASVELAVTVVPAPVDLQLAFEPTTLTVAIGSERTVTLRLSGVPEGATVTVALSATGAATARVMSEPVVFDAATTSHEVTVTGVAAGSATVTAAVGEAVLADSGLPPNSSVASVELAVTVVPAPVDLQLAFEPPALTVAVGSERTATLRLSGVPAGAAVTVDLSTATTATAQVVQESVIFTATTQSHAVTVLGVAEGSATLTSVFADDLADSGLPAGSSVASAQLAVTVVPAPPEPVMLALAFEPTSLTVTVGNEATAVLSLLDVPPGVEVAVDLSAADATTARVLSQSMIFSAEATSREVTVLGVAAGSVTITAAVGEAVLTDSLPSGSSVTSAELAVTVVLPTVDLQLAFEPPTLTVVAGSTATAMLGLEGVPAAGGAVTVRVSVADAATAEVIPAEVIFTEASPSTVVTLTGVVAGNATVTAVTVLLDGLSEDSTVQLAHLAVTVVPAPVHLQLAFDQTSLTVAADATATAVLSLSGVPEGISVTVELISADEAAAAVMPTEVTFTEARLITVVTVTGAAGGSVAITALVTEAALADSGLPEGSSVASAQLQITVVAAPGLRLRVRVLLEGPLR